MPEPAAEPIRVPAKPCPTCPWRVDAHADGIPGFSLEMAEGLERTCHTQLGSPMFACHGSQPGKELVCAGWLSRHGWDSIPVRLLLMNGRVNPSQCEPGADWPQLHENFDEVIAKLRADIARLRSADQRPHDRAHALTAFRVLADGTARQYTATTFPEDPWQGCEHLIRTARALGYLTDSPADDPDSATAAAYAVLDVLDGTGDIVADYLIPTAHAFRWWKRKLDLRVESQDDTPDRARPSPD